MRHTRQDISTKSPNIPPGTESQWDMDEVSGTINRLQEKVMSTAKDAYESIVDNASRTLTTLNRQGLATIRNHPVRASVGALVTGFVLGALLFRSRSESET